MSSTTSEHEFFITCAKGLEPLLFDELQQLVGADEVKQTVAGCRFIGPLASAYRICLWSRFASRVLLQLGQCEVNRAADIPVKVAAQTKWTEVLQPQQTFIIDFNGQHPEIRHTQFGAQLVKDAIVDSFKAEQLERPNVDKAAPDIRINAHLHRNQLTWYLDFSGHSLHLRGYRLQQGTAPLRETLAAAVAQRAGVEPKHDVILDPFCGSGTLLLEAAMMLTDRAPGLTCADWGFSRWNGHQAEVWQSQLSEATERHESAKSEMTTRFIGVDNDPKMLQVAADNCARLGLSELFTWQQGKAEQFAAPSAENGLLLCNPPYGERLGEEVETLLLYRRFGQNLRDHFQQWQVAILAGDESLLKRLKLRSDRKYKLYNGAIEVVLALYDLHKEQVEFTKSESSDLANRLKKNYQKIEKWAAKEGLSAFRVYDADLPEYNAAVDIYNDSVVIQEYAAPKDIPPAVAKDRLWFLVDTIAQTLPIAEHNMVLKVRQRQSGKKQYEKQRPRELVTYVNEYDVQFEVNLSDYLDTGLFLDHRWARREFGRLSKGKSVLNLFAYTCSASVYAALNGAKEVVSVDLSKTYLAWGERNFELNGLNSRKYQFVHADCIQWLRQQRPQQRFDVIFLDPPTFSNSKRMEDVLDIQRDHIQLLKLTARLLTNDGVIMFSNNKKKFKLDWEALNDVFLTAEDVTEQSISLDFKRHRGIHHLFKVSHRA